MGRIVYQPEQPHRCAVQNPMGPYAFSPVGSVYECECGRSWVAKENPAPGQLYRRWVPESRRQRRHRRRTEKRRHSEV